MPAAVLIFLVLFYGLSVTGQSGSQNFACNKVYSGGETGTIEDTGGLFGYFCNYEVSISSKKQINLTFTRLEMEGSGDELFNYLLVFDGRDCMSPRLGVAYGDEMFTFITTGNSTTILFVAGFPEQMFQATYMAVTGLNATKPKPPSPESAILDNCGKEMTGNSGVINFRANGSRNELCVWRLKVPEGRRIILQLTTLMMTTLGSWMRALDGSTCGSNVLLYLSYESNILIFRVNSTSNVMLVMFSSATGNRGDEISASYYSAFDRTTPTVATTTSSAELPTPRQAKKGKMGAAFLAMVLSVDYGLRILGP